MDVVRPIRRAGNIGRSAAGVRQPIWGRGAMDMKGIGVAHLYALIALKRQKVPLNRDVILMAVPDEEIGGALGKWMREKHYADFEPEYILDEGGFGSRDLFAPGKLVFGISVAEKKIIWLKLTAEGVAGHGSQPHDRNPNDRLIRALARLLAEPLPASSFGVLETLRQRVGTLAQNKFNNAIQHSTISITSFRSGVGNPPKVNVIPSIAEATLDCRVLPGTSKDEWLKEIARRLGDPDVKMEVTYESEDPIVTTQDSALYRAPERGEPRCPEARHLMVIPAGSTDWPRRQSCGFIPAILPAAAVASMHGTPARPRGCARPGHPDLFDALRDTARAERGGCRYSPGSIMRRDIVSGIRHLATSPTFTGVAVLSLSLGIMSTTAIYSVVHAVILDPFPYKDVDSLMSVRVWDPGGRGGRTNYTTDQLVEIAGRNTIFEGVIASTWSDVLWTGAGDPQRLRGNHGTMNTFDVMGVAPLLGRTPVADDARPGAPPVVVLGYPGLSPNVFVRTESQDPFVKTAIELVVPDNTVSMGAIGA
jgi:hypothetical protein